jgi:serine/threonine protein kinase
MHNLHMIHTDLKPENILLVSSDYVKVPDYKVMLSFLPYFYAVLWPCFMVFMWHLLYPCQLILDELVS